MAVTPRPDNPAAEQAGASAAAQDVPEPAVDGGASDPRTPPRPGLPIDPATGARPTLPPRPEARPRIVEDPAILGLSRVSRSRLGSRLFTWFFVLVYAVILVQLIVSLLRT